VAQLKNSYQILEAKYDSERIKYIKRPASEVENK
jgi:hypothetical protein